MIRKGVEGRTVSLSRGITIIGIYLLGVLVASHQLSPCTCSFYYSRTLIKLFAFCLRAKETPEQVWRYTCVCNDGIELLYYFTRPYSPAVIESRESKIIVLRKYAYKNKKNKINRTFRTKISALDLRNSLKFINLSSSSRLHTHIHTYNVFSFMAKRNLFLILSRCQLKSKNSRSHLYMTGMIPLTSCSFLFFCLFFLLLINNA